MEIATTMTIMKHDENAEGLISAAMCPGDGGGANIYAPPAADPTTGFLYVPSANNCSWQRVIPGEEADARIDKPTWPHGDGRVDHLAVEQSNLAGQGAQDPAWITARSSSDGLESEGTR